MAVLIVGIVISFVLGIITMHYSHQRREMEHRERMAAMASGRPWPPVPAEGTGGPGPAPRDYFRRGLVWLFLGIGLFLALTFASWTLPYHDQGHLRRLAFIGLVPAAVGIAYIVYYASEQERE